MTMRAREEGHAGRRFGPALAVAGVLVGGAACVIAPVRPVAVPADHTVNIVFTGGCPQRAVPQGNVCGPNMPQCLRVRYAEQVLFQATTADGRPTDDKLAVQFDPFQGPPGQGVGFVLLTVRMQAKTGVSKTFPYNVQSGTCPPLDPEIIVDW
jgi:hypothetical protein